MKKNKIYDQFLLGMNYWPSSTAISMWSNWKPQEYEEDIRRMKSLGMNLCRFFLFMPDFMPEEKSIDASMIERLRNFLEICEKHKMYSMPSFFVGHMSGEDWDVSWRNNRDFITNKEMIAAEKYYIKEVVQQTKNYSHIIGWLLSNELPNYIGQKDPYRIANWTEEIINTIKSLDPDRPVSIGDGAWAPEITARQTGFPLSLVNKYQDFVGLHYYPRGGDKWRHSFTTAFRLRMAANWHKPVFVEEVGTSTTLCSEQNQALYYRSVLYSSLINNSFGTLGWCLNDFDFKDKRPYAHHPFEERFGIVKTDKTIKPAGREFKDFSRISSEIYSEEYEKQENNIGLLIPSYFYTDYPYMFEPHFKDWYDFYLETFSLLKRGGMDVECIVEPPVKIESQEKLNPENKDLDPAKYPLLFAPRLKLFTKKYWQKIVDYVKKGGTLYASFANDSWVLDWHELAGIEMDCKFGVPDYRPGAELKIKSNKNWGVFQKDQKIVMELGDQEPELGYCRILHTRGEVLLEDQYNHPVLILNQDGKGRVYFSAYPLEMMSLKKDNQTKLQDSLIEIYSSLYQESFHSNNFQLKAKSIEKGIWKNRTNSDYKVILFNHDWQESTGILSIPDNYKIESDQVQKKDKNGNYQLNLGRKSVLILDVKKT